MENLILNLFQTYSVFDFDPMHVLSLGIRKFFKECLVSNLSDDLSTATVSRTKSGSSRTFKAAKRFVLESLNVLLKRTSSASPELVLNIDILHKSLTFSNSVLFCEQGLTTTLEDNDLDSFNKILLFLGAFSDACCENENAKITRTHTSYIGMVRFFFKKDKLIG